MVFTGLLRMNRLFHFTSLVLLPVSLSLSSCAEEELEAVPQPAETAPALSEQALAQLTTDSVRMSPVRLELRLEGRVVPNADRTTEVYPLVGGVLEKVPVSLGDQVERGQVLAVIRSTHMAELEQQRATAEVALHMAQQHLTATEDLYADGLTSAQVMALARLDLQKAEAEIKRLRRQTEVYGVEGSRYVLKAPQAGTITEKVATEGMQFAPDQVGSLFTLANLDEVWVMADVFQSDIAQVRTGLGVEISLLSYPNQTFTGQVDKVFSMLRPDSKTMQVRVRLSNPQHLLKPGMYARLRLQSTTPERLAAVPTSSLIFAKGQRYALVQKGSTVETRTVAVQYSAGGVSYLSSGLEAGEQVVTSNPLLLYKELND